MRTTMIDTFRTGGWLRQTLLLLLVPLLAACDSLLDATNPSQVLESDLDNPALAGTLRDSALGRFECAFTSYVISTGVLAQELINSSGWANITDWGRLGEGVGTTTGTCPTTSNASAMGAYTAIQQARYLAEDGVRRIENFSAAAVPDRDLLLAQLNVYAGYSRLLLGEGYCEMAIDEGPLLTRADVVRSAIERFDAAESFAVGVGNEGLRFLAVLGRARARLDLGEHAAAAEDAARIPSGFVWNAQYSSSQPLRENRVFNINRPNRFLSVEPGRYAHLTVEGVPDHRVPVSSSGLLGHDGITAHWYQLKYSSAASPIPLASWEEAQLILAEARPAEAVAALNRLRAAEGLPAYTGNGSLEDVLEERRRQLFLEGHRLNDMVRHGLPFPTGFNHKGQQYGPITCMPLPEQEWRSNPNL